MPKLHEYSEFQNFKVPGRWWTPNTARKKIPGILHYTEDDITLELEGAFNRFVMERPLVFESPELQISGGKIPIAYGTDRDGTCQTLLGGVYKSRQYSNFPLKPKSEGKVKLSRISFDSVLIGAHLQDLDRQNFLEMQLQLPGLESWYSQPIFDAEHGPKPTITCSPPESVDLVLKEPGCTISFKHNAYSHVNDPFSHAEIRNSTTIILKPHKPMEMSYFTSFIRKFENLFTIFYGSEIQVSEIKLLAKHRLRTKESSWVFLRYRRRVRNNQPPSWHDMSMRYKELYPYLAAIFTSLLSIAKNVNIALNMIAELHNKHFNWQEDQFLIATRATEILSRTQENQLYCDPKVFDNIRSKLIEAIPSNVPKELRQSLSNRLKYGNEISLRKKIRSLLDHLEPETVDLICKHKAKFADGISNTRNHFTHYTFEPGHTLKGLELYWAIQKLRNLVSIVLLIQLGCPEEIVRKCFRERALSEKSAWLSVSEIGSPL